MIGYMEGVTADGIVWQCVICKAGGEHVHVKLYAAVRRGLAVSTQGDLPLAPGTDAARVAREGLPAHLAIGVLRVLRGPLMDAVRAERQRLRAGRPGRRRTEGDT